MQVVVEPPLAEGRVDVLRDAQEVDVGIRIAAALGKRRRELTTAWCVSAALPDGLVRTIAEIRTRSEERDDLAVPEELGDEREVTIVDRHRREGCRVHVQFLLVHGRADDVDVLRGCVVPGEVLDLEPPGRVRDRTRLDEAEVVGVVLSEEVSGTERVTFPPGQSICSALNPCPLMLICLLTPLVTGRSGGTGVAFRAGRPGRPRRAKRGACRSGRRRESDRPSG